MHDPERDAKINPFLVRATHTWASGKPLPDIVDLTTVEEGHLLSALRRLAELLRHVYSACRCLGDLALATRVNDAHATIHRDMVCEPPLYIPEGRDGDDVERGV